jgi:hypothetical protein
MKRKTFGMFAPSRVDKGFALLVVVAGLGLTTQSKAQTCGPPGCIEEIYNDSILNLNFLEYLQPDAALPSRDFQNPQLYIGVGGNFVPNPPGASITFSNEQAFATQTTVTATQNGQTYPLYYQNSPAIPDFFGAIINYAPALTGSWTLQVTNPSYASVSYTTQAIPSTTPVIPFISNIQVSNLSPTATLSWVQPTFTQPSGTTRYTTLSVQSIPSGQIIDQIYLSGAATSYNLANLAIPMVAGSNYAISVDTALKSIYTDQVITTSYSYLNFAPINGEGGGRSRRP